MNRNAFATAQAIRRLLTECSPLIEEYTAAVCPSCTEVCCKQRHGAFTEKDRAYLNALETDVPRHDPAWPPDRLCQFLGPGGCVKPRWQRAWKCTWYYCDPLLEALRSGPARKARRLSALQRNILGLYDKLEGDARNGGE